ncbi:uncharacterized protein LOC120105879 [Phoenix dactylifera]|uniref:Uncharacterized protein LOC120105879 n=1 Tax=Phoenix dactylifera TaxID=42345 RepID=A0A8B8ZSQ2_PHODC|nr:uncharacterized protein LOC120105879 [Phoenix dactylifera]
MALFIWKVVWDCLPTRRMLARRGIEVSPMCMNCPEAVETISHVLFECPQVAQIWRRASFPGLTFGVGDFLQQVRNALRSPSTAGWGTAAVFLAYYIWLDRNARVFEGRRASLRSVVERALCQAVEILEATEVDSSGIARDIWDPLFATTVSGFVFIAWEPPPPGYLKVNFDGSLPGGGNQAGVAFVIRDHGARLIAAGGCRSFEASAFRGLHITLESFYGLSILLWFAADWVASFAAHHSGEFLWTQNFSVPFVLRCLLDGDVAGSSHARIV